MQRSRKLIKAMRCGETNKNNERMLLKKRKTKREGSKVSVLIASYEQPRVHSVLLRAQHRNYGKR